MLGSHHPCPHHPPAGGHWGDEDHQEAHEEAERRENNTGKQGENALNGDLPSTHDIFGHGDIILDSSASTFSNPLSSGSNYLMDTLKRSKGQELSDKTAKQRG